LSNWLETLALDLETAINRLDTIDQQHYRHAVARIIRKINQRNM
jgi:hypothetical protein